MRDVRGMCMCVCSAGIDSDRVRCVSDEIECIEDALARRVDAENLTSERKGRCLDGRISRCESLLMDKEGCARVASEVSGHTCGCVSAGHTCMSICMHVCMSTG